MTELPPIGSIAVLPEDFRPDPDRGTAWLWSVDAGQLLWHSTGALPGPAGAAAGRLAAIGAAAPERMVQSIERLRLPGTGLTPVTCLCRPLPLHGGGIGILTMLPGAPERPRTVPVEAPPVSSASAAAAAAVAAEARPSAEGATAIAAVVAPAAASVTEPVALVWIDDPPAKRRSRRFVWQTDPSGRFVHVSRELADAVGPGRGILVGMTMGEIAERFGLADATPVIAALTGRVTWSAPALAWPTDDGRFDVPVELAGVPVLDEAQEFQGFRGYGIARIEAAVPRAADPPPPHPAHGLTPDGGIAPSEEATPALPWTATDGDDERNFDADRVEGAAATEAEAATVETAPPQGSAPVMSPSEAAPSQASASPAPAPTADVIGAADRLSSSERMAFREIAKALGVTFEGDQPRVVQGLRRATDQAVTDHPRADTTRIGAPAEGRTGPDMGASAEAGWQGLDTDQATRSTPSLDIVQPAVHTGLPPAPDTPPPGLPHLDPAASAGLSAFMNGGRAPSRPVSPARPPSPSSTPVIPFDAEIARRGLRAPAKDPLAIAAPQLIDRLPVGLLVLQNGSPVHVNATLLELLGYPDLASFTADGGMDRLFRGRTPEEPDERTARPIAVVDRNGEAILVEAIMQAVTWDDRPATMITVRRAADTQAASRSKALELDLMAARTDLAELRSILDTATDGVIMLDGRGRIVGLNRSAEALFGYDQKEVTGEPLGVLLHEESYVVAKGYLESLREPGVAAMMNDGREVVGRERKGGRLPLFMTLGRLSDGTGDAAKLCAVLRDITAFKKTEGELIEAKRAAESASQQKSEFLARISHEIRTPMNAVIGFAQVMLAETHGPITNDRYRGYLRDIAASGEHVISLVNDLLDLSKIEAGRMDLAFTSVDLNAVVTGCVAIMQPQANQARVILRTQLAPRLPPVVADERAMRQIILNLLSNGVRYTEAGGQVIITTAMTERGEVAIRVRDTGIGMTDSELQAALQPFRQVAHDRAVGGTGLGLPLTKALVEANRATMVITSAAGDGTLVEVVFPSTRVLAE